VGDTKRVNVLEVKAKMLMDKIWRYELNFLGAIKPHTRKEFKIKFKISFKII